MLAYVDATVKKIDLNSTTAYNVGLPLLLVLSTLFLGITLFVLYRRARRDELLEATIQDVGSDSHSPKSAMSEKSIRPVKA